jgi:hypothetical protein
VLRCPVAAPTAAAPFTWEIAFHVPPGFAFSGVETGGVPLRDVDAAQDGEVLRVRFVPEASGDLTLVAAF